MSINNNNQVVFRLLYTLMIKYEYLPDYTDSDG